MTEKRWRDLADGDVVLLKGARWTVDRVKVKGKAVRVTITGKLAGRETTLKREMPAKERVEVAPLHDRVATGDGSVGKVQSRWARDDEVAEAAPPRVMPAPRPAVDPDRLADVDWDEPETKGEKRLHRILGAELLAVQTESGAYFAPPIRPETLASHLLVMHGIRYDGVSVDELRKLEASHTLRDAQKVLDIVEMTRLHDADHAAYEAGTKTLHTPHFHTSERPSQ